MLFYRIESQEQLESYLKSLGVEIGEESGKFYAVSNGVGLPLFKKPDFSAYQTAYADYDKSHKYDWFDFFEDYKHLELNGVEVVEEITGVEGKYHDGIFKALLSDGKKVCIKAWNKNYGFDFKFNNFTEEMMALLAVKETGLVEFHGFARFNLNWQKYESVAINFVEQKGQTIHYSPKYDNAVARGCGIGVECKHVEVSSQQLEQMRIASNLLKAFGVSLEHVCHGNSIQFALSVENEIPYLIDVDDLCLSRHNWDVYWNRIPVEQQL